MSEIMRGSCPICKSHVDSSGFCVDDFSHKTNQRKCDVCMGHGDIPHFTTDEEGWEYETCSKCRGTGLLIRGE